MGAVRILESRGKLRLALQLAHMLLLLCRATFDTDNIDIGPERRNYLDHRLSRVWEMNSEVRASCTLPRSPQLPHCTPLPT